jgi:enoyl-[acyl-carrier-protein] reductase (NADH)
VARGENADPEDVRPDWLERIPLGRFQTPPDIAKVILFLASDEASEITGDTIYPRVRHRGDIGAAAVLMFLLTLTIQRYVVTGLSMGAVK